MTTGKILWNALWRGLLWGTLAGVVLAVGGIILISFYAVQRWCGGNMISLWGLLACYLGFSLLVLVLPILWLVILVIGPLGGLLLGLMEGLFLGALTRSLFFPLLQANTKTYRLSIGAASVVFGVPLSVIVSAILGTVPVLVIVSTLLGTKDISLGGSDVPVSSLVSALLGAKDINIYVDMFPYTSVAFIMALIIMGQLYAGWYINGVKKENARTESSKLGIEKLSADELHTVNWQMYRTNLNRAYAARERNNFAEALNACDAALAISPDSAIAHNLRGVVLESLGRKSDALAEYERALTLDPTHRDATENLAKLSAEIGGPANSAPPA